ncbi:MAG: helical backbone metal receptor [Chloroflexota bacterium]
MPPHRLVSLVPSVTESLFDLGLGGRVVGITDYCVHPADKLARLPRMGGTKNARVADVIALQPDLVIANREENTRADVEALQAAGLEVWVTHPETVRDAIDLLWEIVRRFDVSKQGQRIAALETAYEWTVAASTSAEPAPGRPLLRWAARHSFNAEDRTAFLAKLGIRKEVEPCREEIAAEVARLQARDVRYWRRHIAELRRLRRTGGLLVEGTPVAALM